jgi:hypothetical protein
MDPLRVLVAANGFFTRAEAAQCGHDDRAVGRAVRARLWRRIRRGAYVFEDDWVQLDAVERHVVLCKAVLRSLGSNVALSHQSGLAVHGVQLWGVDLAKVHVTRLDGGAGRDEAGVVHHEGFCLDDDIVEKDGLRLLRPERCAVEAASRTGDEAALVLMDSLLHLELCDRDELEKRFRLMWHWPYVRHLHIPVGMADGRSASPGESRGRWLCWACRLPAPELQYAVRDRDGALVALTDWAWPALDALGEFDGQVKYGRLLKPGQEPGDVVFAEKQREDRIRELTGMRMIRLVWSDYDQPAATARRLRDVLRVAA